MLSCNPSYVEFLAQELLPWARQQYHATDDPARTVLSGMSAGGLIAAYADLRHPEIFGKILCQPPSATCAMSCNLKDTWCITLSSAAGTFLFAGKAVWRMA